MLSVWQRRTLRPPALPIFLPLVVFLALALAMVGIEALVYTTLRGFPAAGTLTPAPVVYFAPGGSPTAAVVQALGEARVSVHVQAYSFTSAPIAKALVQAQRRGVAVTAILDRSNLSAQYSAADFLAHEGVTTLIDARHAIAHNKIMIVDGAIVLTGSFNFTKAAEEKNAENLLVLHDKKLARQYDANWQIHFAHSEPYAGR